MFSAGFCLHLHSLLTEGIEDPDSRDDHYREVAAALAAASLLPEAREALQRIQDPEIMVWGLTQIALELARQRHTETQAFIQSACEGLAAVQVSRSFMLELQAHLALASAYYGGPSQPLRWMEEILDALNDVHDLDDRGLVAGLILHAAALVDRQDLVSLAVKKGLKLIEQVLEKWPSSSIDCLVQFGQGLVAVGRQNDVRALLRMIAAYLPHLADAPDSTPLIVAMNMLDLAEAAAKLEEPGLALGIYQEALALGQHPRAAGRTEFDPLDVYLPISWLLYDCALSWANQGCFRAARDALILNREIEGAHDARYMREHEFIERHLRKFEIHMALGELLQARSELIAAWMGFEKAWSRAGRKKKPLDIELYRLSNITLGWARLDKAQ